MTESKKLTEKAKELRDLSFQRNFSENLHDYLFILTEDDAMVQKMIDFLKANPQATELEVFEKVDEISPPPKIEIEK